MINMQYREEYRIFMSYTRLYYKCTIVVVTYDFTTAHYLCDCSITKQARLQHCL